MARKQKITPVAIHPAAQGPRHRSPYDDPLWDFAFDQMVALTTDLVQSKVFREDQVLHVVRLFARATRTAGRKQSYRPKGFASTLVWCGTDVMHDYGCYANRIID